MYLTILSHNQIFPGGVSVLDYENEMSRNSLRSPSRNTTISSARNSLDSALESLGFTGDWSPGIVISAASSQRVETATRYKQAFFADDKPNWKAHETDYSLLDPHFKRNKESIIPYTIPPANKTVYMDGTNTHPILSGVS